MEKEDGVREERGNEENNEERVREGVIKERNDSCSIHVYTCVAFKATHMQVAYMGDDCASMTVRQVEIGRCVHLLFCIYVALIFSYSNLAIRCKSMQASFF